MRAVAYYHGPLRILELAQAFQQGCAARGVQCDLAHVRTLNPVRPADVVWFYGFGEGRKVFDAYPNALRVSGDSGYFNTYLRSKAKPEKYFRIAVNAQQPDAHLTRRKHSPDRFNRWGIGIDTMQRGERILLCGMGIKQAAMNGFRYGEWEQRVYETLRTYTDRPIHVREKPKNKHIPGIPRCNASDIGSAMRLSWAVVCNTGNIGADAILHGIPVFANAGPGRVYYHHDLSEIDRAKPLSLEDRLSALSDLSHWNWTAKEIAAGRLWDQLKSERML
jgi:hypothetical protein